MLDSADLYVVDIVNRMEELIRETGEVPADGGALRSLAADAAADLFGDPDLFELVDVEGRVIRESDADRLVTDAMVRFVTLNPSWRQTP